MWAWVEHGVNDNASKTHCKNGHEFNEENTRMDRTGRGDNVQRTCRRCAADRQRVFKSKKAELMKEQV